MRFWILAVPVRPFGHILHLIHAFLRSFQISYFTDEVFSLTLLPIFLLGTLNEVGNPLHGIPITCLTGPPLIIFEGFTNSLIGQTGGFATHEVMGGTAIILLPQSTLTHRLLYFFILIDCGIALKEVL